MRLCWNFLWLTALAAWPLTLTGCSGINTSQSVSPASFFLPGLMKNDAPVEPPALTPQNSTEIATSR